MGYCKPIPPNAQKLLDEKTSKRIIEMQRRGEPIRTLHDLHQEYGKPR